MNSQPNSQPGKKTRANPSVEEAVEAAVAVQQRLAALRETLEELRGDIAKYLDRRHSDELLSEDGQRLLATYHMHARDEFDRNAFAEAHPRLYAKFLEHREVRRLLLK